MAGRKGKCTNFLNCEAATRKRVVDVPEGADFVCPTCSRPLTALAWMEKNSALPLMLGVVVVVLALSAAAWQKYRPRPEKAGHVVAVLLRLHGSNTIGAQLAPTLAEAFLKSQGASDVLRVPGRSDEMLVQGVLPGSTFPQAIEIYAHGSRTAFEDLAAGQCDIGMSSRKINAKEVQTLAPLGDMISPACEHILGLDGIAVIVNRGNSLRSLTKERLAKMFAGEITEWSQVRGSGGTIKVYARDDKSGTFDTFKALILDPRKLVGSAVRMEDSRALSDAVAGDPDAIGFVGLQSELDDFRAMVAAGANRVGASASVKIVEAAGK